MRGLLLLAAASALAACDRFDPVPVRPDPPPSPDAARVVRPAAEAVIQAATACVEHCELGASKGSGPAALSDSCAVAPEAAERLRRALSALGRALDGGPRAGASAPAGFLALGGAMASSLRTATLSPDPVAGLSMQYASLARAFNALYPDAQVAIDPPSLLASMKVVPDDASCLISQPSGGYNCKTGGGSNICWFGRGGATRPPTCDLRGVTPPSPLVWKLGSDDRPVLALPPPIKGK